MGDEEDPLTATLEDEPYNYPSSDNLAAMPIAATPVATTSSSLAPQSGCCPGRKVGKIRILYETRTSEGRPKFLCVLGAWWPMHIFTQSLIIGISLGCYISFFPCLEWYICLPATLTLIALVTALALTGFTDPGIQPRYSRPPQESWRWSEPAQSYRAPGVVYCSESGVLVKDIDHFCPWTGTTIAGGNIRYFYAFICMLFTQLLTLMMVLFVGMSKCHRRAQ